MKSLLIILIIMLGLSFHLTAQSDNNTENSIVNSSQHRINFYVVNKPKTFDLFSKLVIVRARKKGMTRGDKFIVIWRARQKK